MDQSEFLTERQLAAKLQCSVPAIRVWRREGMPARRFGRLVRFELEPVLRFFAERQAAGQRKTARPSGGHETAR